MHIDLSSLVETINGYLCGENDVRKAEYDDALRHIAICFLNESGYSYDCEKNKYVREEE